jgi:hypothetical protein
VESEVNDIARWVMWIFLGVVYAVFTFIFVVRGLIPLLLRLLVAVGRSMQRTGRLLERGCVRALEFMRAEDVLEI